MIFPQKKGLNRGTKFSVQYTFKKDNKFILVRNRLTKVMEYLHNLQTKSQQSAKNNIIKIIF